MKMKRLMMLVCVAALTACVFCVPTYAASGDVVFPAIDLILAVFFFAKLGTAYFDYRKHGQFEWAAPAILFACLVFTLTAPLYVWQILGM